MARSYHPDIVITPESSEEEKKKANNRFVLINWAYEMLTQDKDKEWTKPPVFLAPAKTSDDPLHLTTTAYPTQEDRYERQYQQQYQQQQRQQQQYHGQHNSDFPKYKYTSRHRANFRWGYTMFEGGGMPHMDEFHRHAWNEAQHHHGARQSVKPNFAWGTTMYEGETEVVEEYAFFNNYEEDQGFFNFNTVEQETYHHHQPEEIHYQPLEQPGEEIHYQPLRQEDSYFQPIAKEESSYSPTVTDQARSDSRSIFGNGEYDNMSG